MGTIRRIAVNTGGGDAPGLNAVIRAVTLTAVNQGIEVFGIRQGYGGLLKEDGVVPLNRETVRGITHLGGTILGTTNRGNPFEYPVEEADGSIRLVDVSDRMLRRFQMLGLDALVAIGGDGSLRIAQRFFEKGLPVVGVPKTIDNDLAATATTFGFDTAFNTAVDAIDKLHSTAQSHERVMVVELMGRYCGWIALHSGIAATADAILIPEIPFDLEKVSRKIMERELRGRHFSIVVVAEGAMPKGGDLQIKEKVAGREVRLGGIGEWVATELQKRLNKECRSIVLGHLQRGGTPTAFDRLLSLRLGAASVRFIQEGRFGQMVALVPPGVAPVPIKEAIEKLKTVPLDGDVIRTARDVGICLGD